MALVALAMGASAAAWPYALRQMARNVVKISPLLITSGQPSAEALAGLRAHGFDAVIYLAPPTDQINLRASSMFLYRTIALKDDRRAAYATLAGVWSPHGPWRRLIESQLQKHGIAIEIF